MAPVVAMNNRGLSCRVHDARRGPAPGLFRYFEG